MLLVSVAELVNISQGAIAGYLTIAVRAQIFPAPEEDFALTLLCPAVHGVAVDGGGVLSGSRGRSSRGQTCFRGITPSVALF